MLFPAIVWLFIQFSMSGVFIGSSANAMPVEICSSFGIQTILIDMETGEPTEEASSSSCDWCHSFSVVTDPATRHDVTWTAFDQNYKLLLPELPASRDPLHVVADFQSRAPPLL